MSEETREQRIEKYRAASEQADDLASSNKMQEALAILRQQMQITSDAGDEDYRLFFEEEILNSTAPNYPRQIELLLKSMEWAASRQYGDDYFLYRNTGVIFALQGNADAAIKWYDKALAIKPDDYDAMRSKGISLSEKGDQDAAIQWFDKALAINLADYHAMREKGVCLSKKDEEDAAIQWFDKALAIKPDNYDAVRQKGVSLSKKGDQDAAIQWLDKVLAIKPEDYDAMRQKGVSFSKKGDQDAAIQWFDKALAIKPHDYRAMLQKGVSFSEKGDQDAAIQWYDKALMIKPDEYKAMRQIGVSISKKGDEDAAIQWFDKALAIKPNDYGSMRNKGVSLSKKGDIDAAIQWFDKALAIKPDDYDAMRQKGVSLCKKGDQDAAIQWFEKALAIKPDDYDAMRQKGVSLTKKGEDDTAIQWYDKALAIKPNDCDAMTSKGVSIGNKGNYRLAIQWFDKALVIKPDDYHAWKNKAIALGLNGDSDGAIKMLEGCLRKKPDDKSSKLWLFRFRPLTQAQAGFEDLVKEELKREAQAKAYKEKMEIWRNLTGRSAHKIGNQLFAMLGVINNLKRRNDPTLKEDIDDLDACRLRIGSMMREFKKFSLNQPPNKQKVNIAQFMQKLLGPIISASPQHTITCDVSPDLPECLVDLQKMGEILTELLENAQIHTLAGGRIRIAAQVLSAPASSKLRIIIEDNGPGIEPAMKEKIFEPFFSTRPGASGLGLAIVKQTVENHGGVIRETGQWKKGARFEIDIPLVETRKEPFA
ncbi:MAG: tetratricopeptide repeat protein [Candidatus Sumerlaeota bacterium]|nr:tetratricopeptide repeat protein [Candidatus Sumerlaeota bacterium]